MRGILIATVVTGMLAVSACTQKEVDRTVLGAAIGAVAGEVIDDKPVEGAVAGGAIGYISAQN